jgi:CRP-like cAMP-binding protein
MNAFDAGVCAGANLEATAVQVGSEDQGQMANCDVDPGDVAAIGVFAGLPAQALVDCARNAVARRLAKGELIFHQGDRPLRCHALLSGWVRILQAGTDGELAVMRFVGPGELFGSLAMFAGGGYPADATAAMDAIELSWSETHLRALIDRYPVIALNLVGVAARRLGELQERLREISTQPVEQRVANTILRLARQCAETDAAGAIHIAFPLSRKDVAAMSATTLHSVSRVMAGWERRGIVTSTGRRLAVTSLARLTAIADAPR